MDAERSFRFESFAVWTPSAESPRPDVSFVPPLDRRRLTALERAALSVAWRVRPEGEAPVVFASRWGEIGVTERLIRQFHDEGEMSPAGFSASVHNAAPGAFSLITRSRAAYTAVAARERSVEMGLLEAMAMLSEVLYVYAEESTPELYRGSTDDDQEGCAVAVRISAAERGGGGGFLARARFDRADDAPPVSFAGLVDFLEGRAATLRAAAFELHRE